MVAERTKLSPRVARPQKRSPLATRPSQRGNNWELRRQDILRRERSLVAVLALTSLVGTLFLLYVAVHANATSEGYQRTQLRRAIRREERERLRLQTEIRKIEDGNALAQAAERLRLVRSPEGIHFFTAPPAKEY